MDKNEGQQFAKTSAKSQSRFTLFTILKTIFLISSVVLLFFLVTNYKVNVKFVGGSGSCFWAQPDRTPGQPPDIQPVRDDSRPTSDCRLPTARYDIYTGQAACYPSSGGIWMAELGPLELQHLKINRFESTERSSNQADEDDFCHRLRQFGGSWYNPQSSDDLWVGGQCHDLDERMPVFSISRQVGFPEKGGVWVLWPGEDGRYPDGMSTVRNALAMGERCMALERLGAVFCQDILACPALDDLSKEPCELAGKYGKNHEFCGTEF